MRIEEALLIKTVEELTATFKDLIVSIKTGNKSNERLASMLGPVAESLIKAIEKKKRGEDIDAS